MRIGIVIGRIGGIDGVALETEKWAEVLERLGHEIKILTGELEGPAKNVTLLPELAFSHPKTLAGQEYAFYGKPIDESEFLANLDAEASYIEEKILDWIKTEKIECLLSENASALPCHLTMGMALQRVFKKPGISGVTHDHDFAWERGEQYETPFEGIRKIIAECFPVKLPNVKHAVINLAAQKSLAERFGITETIVVPNVMDFDNPVGIQDEYNADLRQSLGVNQDDILLFQVTRIVSRKGIEIAIDLVHRLENPKVKLILTGTSVDDRKDTYINELKKQTHDLGLDDQILFAGHRFDNNRGVNQKGEKTYSLWDAYAHADGCTYFSLYEGFGNAFVEAIVAKVPIFVNNYEPVYWPDIGSKGFKTVMIEKGILTDEAVDQARAILADQNKRKEIAEHNFKLGQEHFSYQALEKLLASLF